MGLFDVEGWLIQGENRIKRTDGTKNQRQRLEWSLVIRREGQWGDGLIWGIHVIQKSRISMQKPWKLGRIV